MSVRMSLVAVALLIGFCLSATGAQADEPPQPGPKDRCAVCGMIVAAYPDWVAMVSFEDGSTYFFDGPKDMFNFLFDLRQYRPEADEDDIRVVQVTEYYTLQRYAAGDVFFVTGSDVFGPMGHELIPVAGATALRTFLKDHGYKKVLRYDGAKMAPVDPLP